MHHPSIGDGVAGTGGVYIIVDVFGPYWSDRIGKKQFTQNVIISKDMQFDRVLCGRLHVVWRNCH